MLEKITLRHLDTDNSPKDVQPGDYVDHHNLLSYSDNSTGVRRRNVKGTTLLGNFPVSVNAQIIGARYHKALNKSYFAFKDVTSGDSIVEFDNSTSTMTMILQNSGFNFDLNHFVDLRVITGLAGDLLYINDGLNNPRKINIENAKSGLYAGANFSEVAIAQIRKEPTFVVTGQRGTDPSSHQTLNPGIRRIPFQFSLRYVYLDEEVSVLGPVSRIVPASRTEVATADYNMISLQIYVDFFLKPFLDHVELIVREGNTGNWYVYDKIPMSAFPAGDHGITYNFYNDKSGPVLSDLESLPLYQAFPRQTDAMEIHQDRLFEVDSTSDRDSESANWGGTVAISSLTLNQSSSIIDQVVYPGVDAGVGLGYLGLSKYAHGVVFFDEEGRRGPVDTKAGLFFNTPANTNRFSINDLVSAQQNVIQATLNLTGIPPSWAHYYQVVRTPNLTYDWWFAAKCGVKFPVNDFLTTLTAAPDANQYIEDGYLYYLNNSDNNKFSGLIDIVIPPDFPFAIDDKIIIRLAFDYPVGTSSPGGALAGPTIDGSAGVINFEASVIRLVGNKVRINVPELVFFETGYTEIININSWLGNDFGDPDVTYFSKFVGGRFPSGTSTFTDYSVARLHLMFLHPYSPSGDYLFYEVGDLHTVSNPGTASRAFSKTSILVPGDTYMQAYTYFETGMIINQLDWSSATKNEHRSLVGIGYNAMSPILEKRAALFKAALATDAGKPNVVIENEGEKHFGNITRWTDAFSANTDINGFGNMQSGNKYSTPTERGNITKLVSTSENILLAIHARAMTSLYVNVRVTHSREDNSVVTSDDVIGDSRVVAGDYGTINPESVVCVDGYRVYGFDLNTGEPWRKSLDGVTTLATTFKTKKWFKYKSDLLKAAKEIDPTIQIKIIGGFDPFLQMFYLTFKAVTYTNYPISITIPAETIAFSELTKGWVGFFDFIPDWYTYDGNRFLLVKAQNLWIHDADANNCNNFFGVQADAKITLVCNMQSDMDKVWENIGLSTNGDWDVTSILTPDGRQTDMLASNFVQRDDVKYAEILRDTTTPAAMMPPGKNPRLHGQLMISQVVSITLQNSQNKVITLDAMYIGFSPIQGHLMSLKQ